ncbi:MAG: primosomal protein N' [Clostridiales bacterium]|nr:primosomal protein N' [Clostridiales bacterium]
MQVDVVLLKTVNQTDQLYTYNVKQSLEFMIHIGSRVLVPFGRTNKIQEGIVFNVVDGFNKNFKSVNAVFDENYDLNIEMIELIKHLKDYYLSNYSWFLKAAIPSATQLSIETSYIYENDEIKKVLDSGEKSLGALIDEGKVIQKVSYKKKSKEKSIRYLKLKTTKVQLLEEYDKIRSNAVNQKNLLNHFIINSSDVIAISELKVPSGTINSFVKKGIFEIEETNVFRENIYRMENNQNDFKHELNDEQKAVYNTISNAIENKVYDSYLIHGVTGSGKTEIYLHLAEKALEKNKSVLILVPEISLVPQMAQRFIERFGQTVAFYHSKMNQSEKMDEWYQIKTGKFKIIIGARSAVFAPIEKIGLIIIDEEHSSSYKSESQPNYNAKYISLLRGEHHKAPVVFGTATPSVETYYQCINGKMHYLNLSKRVNDQSMPLAYLVDMREELNEGNRSVFSRLLVGKIQDRLDRNEQVILFINKKGYSSFISCRSCGHVMKCPHCDLPLLYHKRGHYGECKICGFKTSIPKTCPECNSTYFKYFGIGTEKIEEMIISKFPESKVIRMDSASMSGKTALKDAYDGIKNNKFNIILGTQIVAKGHDFKNVTLVGILAADINLNVPNFNASEVTYQLLTQAMGRSGRGDTMGEVVVQTYSPDHYAVLSALQHDFYKYMDYELSIRKELKYPPYNHLMNLIISSQDDSLAEKYAGGIAKEIRKHLISWNVEIIGPGPAILEKAKRMYRYQIIIKFQEVDQSHIKGIISNISKKIKNQSVYLNVDVDPVTLI